MNSCLLPFGFIVRTVHDALAPGVSVSLAAHHNLEDDTVELKAVSENFCSERHPLAVFKYSQNFLTQSPDEAAVQLREFAARINAAYAERDSQL